MVALAVNTTYLSLYEQISSDMYVSNTSNRYYSYVGLQFFSAGRLQLHCSVAKCVPPLAIHLICLVDQ